MNISCEVIRDLLPLYADDVCSEESKELVEEHCGECRECQSRLEAMKKPLPRPPSLSGEIKTPRKKSVDPFKKTRRHYIKLAIMTAVISTLIAVPLLVVWTISIKEKYSMLGEDMTWSAMAANGDMKKFGWLIIRGEYEKAFENVGFVGWDNKYYGGEEMDGIRKSFAGVLEEYFKEYTAVSMRCEGGMYGSTGIVKGKCYIGIDESRTKGVPMAIVFDYKYYEGMAYIIRMLAYLERNFKFVREFLHQYLPQIHLVEPEGTYLIWLDCSRLNLTHHELEELIVEEARLWLDPGIIFGKETSLFERINIACPRAVLNKAMNQLKEAVEKRLHIQEENT